MHGEYGNGKSCLTLAWLIVKKSNLRFGLTHLRLLDIIVSTRRSQGITNPWQISILSQLVDLITHHARRLKLRLENHSG